MYSWLTTAQLGSATDTHLRRKVAGSQAVVELPTEELD